MFKKKIVMLLSLVCLIGGLSANVYAATSSSRYTFYMEHRYVSGKDNGMFHDLNSGNAMISGEGSIVGGPSNGGKQRVHFTLVKDGFFGRQVGHVVGDTSGNINAGFGHISGGRYYITVYTLETDGYYRSGSGKIYTN